MTFLQLLLRNLLYHWRGNLAVFLGIALCSAVLTGALLVGDSLRGSLQALTLDQLGWVDHALMPGRFFREQLAKKISAERRAPVLLLQGSATRKDGAGRVGKVNVFGIDASFWPDGKAPEDAKFWSSESGEVVLNQTLANALGVSVGDTISLRVPRANNVPAETLMGERKADEVVQKLNVKVRRIVPDEGMARYSLKPTPEPVRNAFVPIRFLQQKLELEGRINALLVAQAKPELQEDLQKQLDLDDWGLRFRSPDDRAEAFFRLLAKNSSELELKDTYWRDKSTKPPVNRIPDELVEAAQSNNGLLKKDDVIKFFRKSRDYHVLESRRMLLEPRVVEAVERLVPDRKDPKAQPRWRITPVLIYLADTLSIGNVEVPYSIIASDDRKISLKDGAEKYVLADDQILLMDWPGSPLNAQPGSEVTLSYFFPDEKNHLQLKKEKFKVQAVDKIEGPQDDPDFTPEVPGVTDKLDITGWLNPPFPYDFKRNTEADKNYSKRYRTTPRAYVNLKKAQEMWKNRFGDLTSIQVRDGRELAEMLPAELLKNLKPEEGGFVFQPVRDSALKASAGTTDFGEFFFYFSFFLIVAALLLVGLLVRLNIDRRAGEIGLLLALGWDHGRVRWLLLCEGMVLAVAGSLVGLGGALLYAHLMLKLLNANWPGGAGLGFLSVHVGPLSLLIGFFGSLLATVFTLWWGARILSKLSPRSLLSGETTGTTGLAETPLGWSRWLVPGGVAGALLLVIAARFMPSSGLQVACFFSSGALLLTASLAGTWNGLKWSSRGSSPQPTLMRLGLRNAGRNAVRSVLTVGLLASASFLIVAVESFHKGTDHKFNLKTGGSGGFALYAEGNVSVFEDLNEKKIRNDYGLDTPEMKPVEIFPCRVQPGDDASCLNLYKPLKPRLVGFSEKLIQRGGFEFTASAAKSDDERANPWLLLQKPDDDAIPAIIDGNTAQWILKVAVGDTVEVNNGEGKPRKLRIVGLLHESIFQSEILISEKNFLPLYPQQTGYSFLLVDTADANVDTLKTIEQQLGKSMEIFNMDVQTTASRLNGYLAVENMYLATFQALGGLGLILGAAGLAIVLLRGVWERRAELALLQALGFRSGQLAWLVLAENGLLLVLGLAAGTVSALVAVAPHLGGSNAADLWGRIVGLLALVLLVGLLSAVLAVWSTLRTPVLTALRRE